MFSRTAVLTLFLTGAAFTDAREGKIYNYWVLPAFAAGLLWNLLYRQESGDFCKHCLLFPLLLFCLFLPLRFVGGLAAGDIKLLLALSVWFSYPEFFICTFVSLMLGAMSGLGEIAANRIHHAESRGVHTVRFALPVFISFLLHIGGVF